MRQKTGHAGFSILELIVTLAVMIVAVIGALTFFEISTRLADTQTNLSQMQSGQRIAQGEMVRMLSMAGIGGLPEGIDPQVTTAQTLTSDGTFPTGLALSVMNNATAGTDVGDTGTSLPVVTGTDVLTLRGSFSTSVYYIEPPLDLALDTAGNVAVTLRPQVDEGVDQDLDSLRNLLASAGNSPEAFIVYDRYNPGAYAVLEYVAGSSNLGSSPTDDMTIGLSLGSATTHGAHYGRLTLGTTLAQGAGGQVWMVPGAGINVQLPRQIGAIGLLEEFRFFVRQEREVPGKPASRLVPVLTRARYYPGADELHPEGALELSANIVDFQIALAIDLAPNDGQILELGQNADDDEILYNFPGDADGLTNPAASPWANPAARLLFVRLSTVAQTNRPDRDFPGVFLDVVEDHDYSQDAPPSIFNSGNYSKLRKRLLQTIVEVRNLP